MEVDSGAAYSLVGYQVYKNLFTQSPIYNADIGLAGYGNDELPILGFIMVDVKYLNYQTTLPLLVANSDGPALLGRAWFDALQISVTGVNRASTYPFELEGSSLPAQLTDFSENFQETTESCTGPASHIHVRADTVPVFLRAEPVQLALQAAVGQEIDRLVETEVLQQTTALQATSTVSELCDSSAYGLGAVTSHTIADGTTERPIAYGSRTLKPAEINYTPCDTAHYKKYRGGKSCLSGTILPFYKHKAIRSSKKLETMTLLRDAIYTSYIGNLTQDL
jgi:hypothetical protein